MVRYSFNLVWNQAINTEHPQIIEFTAEVIIYKKSLLTIASWQSVRYEFCLVKKLTRMVNVCQTPPNLVFIKFYRLKRLGYPMRIEFTALVMICYRSMPMIAPQ